MYGALLPQFVIPAAGSTTAQLLQLGLVQVAVATVVNAAWVILAAQVARLLRRSWQAERAVRWGTGGLLTFFAVHLGLSRATA